METFTSMVTCDVMRNLHGLPPISTSIELDGFKVTPKLIEALKSARAQAVYEREEARLKDISKEAQRDLAAHQAQRPAFISGDAFLALMLE